MLIQRSRVLSRNKPLELLMIARMNIVSYVLTEYLHLDKRK